jgi:hypothetical protein
VEPAQGLEFRGQAGGTVVDVLGAGCQQVPRLVQVLTESVFAGTGMRAGTAQRAVGGVVQVGQPQRRPRDAVAVAPGAGVRVAAVVGKQPVSAVRDQLCRVDEVVGNDVRDEVIEVDPGPPGLDAPAAAAYLVAEGVRGGCVDFSSRWPYGPAQEQPPRAWIPNRSLSTATI